MYTDSLFGLKLYTLCVFLIVECTQVGQLVASNVNFNDQGTEWSAKEGQIAGYAIKGGRSKMEDRFYLNENIRNTGVSIFAVFDGHGGTTVSQTLNSGLIENVEKKIVALKKGKPSQISMVASQTTCDSKIEETKKKWAEGEKVTESTPTQKTNQSVSPSQYEQLLNDEILDIDGILERTLHDSLRKVGSTALIGILDGNMLTIANVGDSSAVYCDSNGSTHQLSVDHKPDNKDEKERIEKSGGYVTQLKNDCARVNSNLAVSRAIGDFDLKNPKKLVIADPYVKSINIEQFQFLIFASDGVWNFVSNENSVEVVKNELLKGSEPLIAAKNLVNYALSKKSDDNITAIIVKLKLNK